MVRDDGGGPGGSSGGSGSFGWADLNGGGGGASELGTWIDNYTSSGNTGCNTTITVGTGSANIDTETGNKAALQTNILNMINSTHSEISIAIYDDYGSTSASTPCTGHGGSGSNLCYHIKGFARMRLTNVWLTTGGSSSPSSDNGCGNPTTTFGSSRGILALFVGFVDPNGSISASASGPAKVVNVIS